MVKKAKQTSSLHIRAAHNEDVEQLTDIEARCFSMDRLSRRQFRWMIEKAHAELLVLEAASDLLGYVLVLFHRGTSLARLYSLALLPEARGRGLAAKLMQKAEKSALEHNCIYMRLEVHPENTGAIRLYQKMGYYLFAQVTDYYEDHSDALRFEKLIHHLPAEIPRNVPYYPQTMAFSCGPASLIMAMKAHHSDLPANRQQEIQLWREATTIYMTSGHGGCSPEGLALAASRRKYGVELFMSRKGALFLDGVRKQEKKEVMQLVHEDFMRQLAELPVAIHHLPLTISRLERALENDGIPLVLISSYRFNRSKAPHWIVLAAADEHFFYLHDPDIDAEQHRSVADNMYLPVKKDQFLRMTHFGQARMQGAVVIYASPERIAGEN